MNRDIFVVIRSAGERTERACIDIALSQLSNASNLKVVKGLPFGEAHEESIRLAIESQSQWVLFLDADVLLKPDAIETMLLEARKIDQPFFQYNFRVLDRGFSGESYGIHFYSTQYMKNAFEIQRQVKGLQRPEYSTCKEVARRFGIPSISSTITTGLHGYEQFFVDLYRTAFVRSVKYQRHIDFLLKRYYPYDYLEKVTCLEDNVMFWGTIDGILFGFDNAIAVLNKDFYIEKYSKLSRKLNIQERSVFNLEDDFVTSVFSSYKADDLYLANNAWICPTNFYTVKLPEKSISKKIAIKIRPGLSRMKTALKILIGK